ncbi:hypothetical protein LEMLEM_LOCUS3367 [Lemmus lemmus]
MCYRH